MKAERFQSLTEDLISLFGVCGRKAERGAGKYWSALMLVPLMMIMLLTFICPGLLNTSVLPHHHSAYIYTYTHLGYRSAP